MSKPLRMPNGRFAPYGGAFAAWLPVFLREVSLADCFDALKEQQRDNYARSHENAANAIRQEMTPYTRGIERERQRLELLTKFIQEWRAL